MVCLPSLAASYSSRSAGVGEEKNVAGKSVLRHGAALDGDIAATYSMLLLMVDR